MEQGVAYIQRVTIKKNNEEIITDIYIMEFHKHVLSKVLKITDWHHEIVQEYKYRPQPCFNCQRFSHVAKHCRRTTQTCVKCEEEGHSKKDWENDVCCFHCKESHYANDRSSNKYKIESEIILQHSRKTSRLEATRVVFEKIPQSEKLCCRAVTQRKAGDSTVNKEETTT